MASSTTQLPTKSPAGNTLLWNGTGLSCWLATAARARSAASVRRSTAPAGRALAEAVRRSHMMPGTGSSSSARAKLPQ